jgi:hypothetical protein
MHLNVVMPHNSAGFRSILKAVYLTVYSVYDSAGGLQCALEFGSWPVGYPVLFNGLAIL